MLNSWGGAMWPSSMRSPRNTTTWGSDLLTALANVFAKYLKICRVEKNSDETLFLSLLTYRCPKLPRTNPCNFRFEILEFEDRPPARLWHIPCNSSEAIWMHGFHKIWTRCTPQRYPAREQWSKTCASTWKGPFINLITWLWDVM